MRWSFIGLQGRTGPCAMCGGEMVPERRRPSGAPAGFGERRDLVGIGEAASASGDRPSA